MKYTSTYDDARTPPAPVVLITIRRPNGTEQQLRVNALLDTGAEISLLPPALVTALGAVPAGECSIQAVGGAPVGPIFTYFVEFDLEGASELVEVAAWGDEVIVGRNWLNSFYIALDGPQQTITIQAPLVAQGDA